MKLESQDRITPRRIPCYSPDFYLFNYFIYVSIYVRIFYIKAHAQVARSLRATAAFPRLKGLPSRQNPAIPVITACSRTSQQTRRDPLVHPGRLVSFCDQ